MNIRMHQCFRCVFTALLALSAASSARAQIYELNEPGGTNVTITTPESYARILVGRDEADNRLAIDTGGWVSVASRVEVGQGAGATNSTLEVLNGGLLLIGAVDTNGLPGSGIVVGDTTGTGELKVGFESAIETDSLYVGYGAGEYGRVTAGNGGVITVLNDLVIGSTNNSGNSVTIGSDSALYISDTAQLHILNEADPGDDRNGLLIGAGGSLMVQGDVDASALYSSAGVSFEAGARLGVGGTLTAKDNSINNGLEVLLDDSLSTNHTALWHADYMDIGTSTGNNAFSILNGATAVSTNAVSIGTDTAAGGNSLTVSGSNSTFTALGSVYVGINGSSNELSIEEGAEASVADVLKIGSSVSSGNRVTVDGTGSRLAVDGAVVIGDFGRSGELNITGGAEAVFGGDVILGARGANNDYTLAGSTNTVAGNFIIGRTAGATGATGGVDDKERVETTGNLAVIKDAARLDIAQDLVVGDEGGGSILAIRDGGAVHVTGGTVIGKAVGDNYIYLQRGADSRFVTTDLVIGKAGGSNRFAIYGGTAEVLGDLYLGATTNSHDIRNFIHLETTNAVLNVAGTMYIGASNSVNVLELEKGAMASAADLQVGTYAGSTENSVTVAGDGSLLTVTSQLTLGSATGSNNTVRVSDGGTLQVSAQNNLVIAGTDSTVTIADGGTLKTGGWDFELQTGTATNITFDPGSTLYLLGELKGTNLVEGGIGIVLDGAAATWSATGNLIVGFETDDNTLMLTNGAAVNVASNLYIGLESENNTVTLAGSMLDVGGDLQLGAEVDQWQRNSLLLQDGTTAAVGSNVYVYRGSTLSIDSESQLTVEGDYLQDEYSALEIGVSSNQVTPNLIVKGDAGFASSYDPGSHDILKVFNDGVGASNTVTIVRAGTISLDGTEAAAGSLESSISTNSLLGFRITVTNDTFFSYIVLDNFSVRTIGDAGNLEGQLLAVANEIEDMYAAGSEGATNVIRIVEGLTQQEISKAFDDHFGARQSTTPANTVLGRGIQSVAEQVTVRADSTRARRGLAAAVPPAGPEGAEGPHQSGQLLQGWVAGYSTRGSQDAADGFNGYDASVYGALFGVDLSVAENILMGVALGTGSASVDKDNGGGSDIKTTYGSLYASMGTKDWFADAAVIYGGSSVDASLGSAFNTTADYDAQNIAFYLGGGKEITGRYLIITPQASLLANRYSQGDYSETSDGVARAVESFDTLYVRSALGCNIGFYSSVGETSVKTELRGHWLHEFNSDEESVKYRLIGGDGTAHTLFMQAPESDILRLGAGITAKMSEYLELRADLDTRQAAHYSDYTVLGSLRYQF